MVQNSIPWQASVSIVNKVLKAKGIPVRIVKGKGYYYFLDDKDNLCDAVPSYYVYSLKQTTVEHVIKHIEYYLNKNK